MANPLRLYSPEDIGRTEQARHVTELLTERGGSVEGVILGVRNRPERPIQQYESSWLITYEETIAYLSGLDLCTPDPYWGDRPVTATIFTPRDEDTQRDIYDTAQELEIFYHRQDSETDTRLDRYEAQFITATADPTESLEHILDHLDDREPGDGYHTQVGEHMPSRFDKETASERLDQKEQDTPTI